MEWAQIVALVLAGVFVIRLVWFSWGQRKRNKSLAYWRAMAPYFHRTMALYESVDSLWDESEPVALWWVGSEPAYSRRHIPAVVIAVGVELIEIRARVQQMRPVVDIDREYARHFLGVLEAMIEQCTTFSVDSKSQKRNALSEFVRFTDMEKAARGEPVSEFRESIFACFFLGLPK